jgi:Glucodextranase, domain N
VASSNQHSNLIHNKARIGVGGAEKTQNRQPLKRKILQLTLVACAAVYVGQQSIQAQGVAPSGPGGKADWLPANKSGFGTSHTTLSKVWFTLEGGRLSEVYYPRLDTPSVRNIDFMITDGHSFAAQAQGTPAWHANQLKQHRSHRLL